MNENQVKTLWAQATSIDKSVELRATDVGRLMAKYIRPERFSRSRLFQCIAGQKVGLFRGLRVSNSAGGSMAEAIRDGFDRRLSVSVRTGPSSGLRRLSIKDLVERWVAERGIVNVTDLHFRGSKLSRRLNTRHLSEFNLLASGSERMRTQEMMTVVISSSRSMSDSHSDDPDGSNHCFVGKKLWLMWDTYEGMAAGLQDVERQDVYGSASFSMEAFLGTKSSRWLTVREGQTLFLPGRMTHKVLTLEPYIGVGSFHVSLPGCVGAIARWKYRGALWERISPKRETEGLVDEIAEAVLRKIQTLKGRRADACRWGLDYYSAGVRHWRLMATDDEKSQLLGDPMFRRLLR